MAAKEKTVKDRLIEETIRDIEAAGVDKLSLRKIAGRCGVTHASAYKYFENKQELIKACVPYIFTRLSAYLKRAARSAKEPPVALMKAYMRYMILHPQYHYLIHLCPITKTADFSGVRTMARERYTQFWIILEEYLARCGIAEEEYGDILTLTSTLLNGLITLFNRRGIVYRGDPTDLVDEIILRPLNLYPKKQAAP